MPAVKSEGKTKAARRGWRQFVQQCHGRQCFRREHRAVDHYQRHARQHRRGQILGGCRQLVNGALAARQKAGFLQKVRRRIAADGKLRKDGKPGPQGIGASARRNNLLQIPGKISHRGIDLRQCDLHSSSLVHFLLVQSDVFVGIE